MSVCLGTQLSSEFDYTTWVKSEKLSEPLNHLSGLLRILKIATDHGSFSISSLSLLAFSLAEAQPGHASLFGQIPVR